MRLFWTALIILTVADAPAQAVGEWSPPAAAALQEIRAWKKARALRPRVPFHPASPLDTELSQGLVLHLNKLAVEPRRLQVIADLAAHILSTNKLPGKELAHVVRVLGSDYSPAFGNLLDIRAVGPAAKEVLLRQPFLTFEEEFRDRRFVLFGSYDLARPGCLFQAVVLSNGNAALLYKPYIPQEGTSRVTDLKGLFDSKIAVWDLDVVSALRIASSAREYRDLRKAGLAR